MRLQYKLIYIYSCEFQHVENTKRLKHILPINETIALLFTHVFCELIFEIHSRPYSN